MSLCRLINARTDTNIAVRVGASSSMGSSAILSRKEAPFPVELLARSEQLKPVPANDLVNGVGQWITAGQFEPGLWTHQAEALRAFAGANIVVSTSTASGKSLIFQAITLKLLDADPEAAVLVLYPLKALVADQLVSWRQVLTHTGHLEDAIAKVDGDVLPDERRKLVRKARIVVGTPDVIHAWLLRNLANPHHEASIAAELQRSLLAGADAGSFITFIDSRQGAERLAIKTDAGSTVRPYRAGYDSPQ